MKSELYCEVIRALDFSDVRYIVQRGYENFPSFEGDLDLLVSEDDLETAISLTVQTIGRRVLPIVCEHVDTPVVWAGFPESPSDSIEVDLATSPTWGGGPILNVKRVLAERTRRSDFWVARPGDESALSGIPSLFGNDAARTRKGLLRLKRVVQQIEEDRSGAERAWCEALGSRWAKAALDAVKTSDIERISEIARIARARRLFVNTVRNPARTVSRVASVALRSRNCESCGLWELWGNGLLPVRSIEMEPTAWVERLESIYRAHGTQTASGRSRRR